VALVHDDLPGLQGAGLRDRLQALHLRGCQSLGKLTVTKGQGLPGEQRRIRPTVVVGRVGYGAIFQDL
jgi:hypothetical protein